MAKDIFKPALDQLADKSQGIFGPASFQDYLKNYSLPASRGEGMAQIMKPKAFHVLPLHGGIEYAQEVPRIPPISDPVGEDIIRRERSNFRPGIKDVERPRIHG